MSQFELLNLLVNTMGDVLTPTVLEGTSLDANYAHLHTLKTIGVAIGNETEDFRLAAAARAYQRELEILYPDHLGKHGIMLKENSYKPFVELKENAGDYAKLLENARTKFISLDFGKTSN